MAKTPFSTHLDNWLKSSKPKTLEGLVNNFEEKSFAILFLVLMALPALPLPTGGLTHLFELITVLLALEVIAGRRSVWLPKRWRGMNLPKSVVNSGLPKLVSFIAWLEKYSRPRFSQLMSHRFTLQILGLVIIVFAVFAAFAIPFSGLDTLPALGIVLIALSIILEDFLLMLVGILVGSIGVGLVIGLGSAAFKLLG